MTHHRASYRSNQQAMNYYQTASTSQVPLSAADVPDLYYEQGYRTPSSVTSSDTVLSTPPRHLQTLWLQDYHDKSSVAYMSSWQAPPMNSSQSKRPTVAPIDTNLNWSLHDTTESSSMSFISNGESNRARRVAGDHRSSYPRTFVDNDPNVSLGLTTMPDSSALSALHPSPITTPPPSISDPYAVTHPSAANTNQAPLKLHQPRPSRRIPIISLSNLASACDDFAVSTHVQKPKLHPSEEALSPLPFDFNNRVSSMLSLPAVDGANTQHLKYMLYPTSDVYSPTFGLGFDGHSGKAILCNCGCMESYTFR